ALTRRYVEDDLKSIYKGRLFYANDAFAGLHTMDGLVTGANGAGVVAEPRALVSGPTDNGSSDGDSEDLIGEEAKLGIRKSAHPRGAQRVSGDTTHTTRSVVSADVPIPQAPFFGSWVVDDLSLDEVFAFVN